MGRDLEPTETGAEAIPVTLAPAGSRAEEQGDQEQEASGLAYMLHQFIEQTLDASPEKRRLARKLRGEAIFRAAEDEAIQVRIRFCGDRIELSDTGEQQLASAASVTADFLTIAHLTSGQESPFALLARRKLRARFHLREVPFLLRMLAFMRIPSAGVSRPWLWQAGLAGVALACVIYILVRA